LLLPCPDGKVPAMRARELILKPKKVTKAGKWESGPMSRTAFPLSRARNFILGVRWTWRVDHLEIEGVECRLLTAFEPQKQNFLAWLTYKRGDSYVVVARLEFHGHEPGLHCHASCDDIHNLPVGVVKPYPTQRVPKYAAWHRRSTYGMSEATALSTSFGFFRVTTPPEGSMI
jgi:hypothetical protein